MKATRVATAVMGLTVALSTMGAPVAAAGPTTRIVDDDGLAGRSGCNGTRAVPRKVQRAIHDAGPGDTILVCPGTYTEQLTIRGERDGLTVKAVEPWTAVIRTPRNLAVTDYWDISRSALITIKGVDGVRVQSLQLAVRTRRPCDLLDYGVWVRHAKDAQVRSLRIEPGGPNTLGRCGIGIGIFVSDSSSAFVGYNVIRDFAWAGIEVSGRGTRATLYRDSIRYLHAAETFHADGGSATGIGTEFGPRVTIRDNVVRSGPGPGFHTPVLGYGMDLSLGTGSVVNGNTVHRADFGVSVDDPYDDTHDTLVKDNFIEGGTPWDGTGLGVSDASTYSGNRVSGYYTGVYGGDGGATFLGNDFRGNHLDCQAWTDGFGGWDGKWIDNLGDTSDPPDICSPGP